MSAEPSLPSDPGPRLIEMPQKRLWFGFAGSVAAWLALGCVDIVISWRACMHQMDFGVPPEHMWAKALIFLVGLLFLGITISAGIISYQSWRRLTEERKMLDTPAVPRGEFMAVLGVIVSLTLGAGMVWMALTPLFIELCWRAK